MNLFRIVLPVLAASSLLAQNEVVASGKITDAVTGLPVEGAAITLTLNGPDGPANLRFSDAGGGYSFDAAKTGPATVTIEAPGFLPFQKTDPDAASIRISADRPIHDFKLTPAASIVGKATGDDPNSTAGMTATLYREDFTDGVRHFVTDGKQPGMVSRLEQDGSFRFTGLEPGRYIVAAGWPPGRSGRAHPSADYVPSYYPGATNFAAAIPISVRAGETIAADFRMEKHPLFRASGEAAIPAFDHTTGTVGVEAVGEGAPRGTWTAPIALPGPFAIEGLPAGQYKVTTIVIQIDHSPDDRSFRLAVIRPDLSFTITDHDVDGLVIHPSSWQQLNVSGSFRMARADAPLPAGLAVQFAYPEPGGESTPIPASGDGTFWLSGEPGDYSIRPVVPPGYAVTEIRCGAGNDLNSLIPIGGDTADQPLAIVLSDQPGSVRGSVLNGEGKPVPATIALLPDPLPANFDFRAIRSTKTDEQGGFIFSGIAPGQYKALALTGDDRKQDRDLTLLGPRLGLADSFEVTASQNVTLHLQP